MAGGPRQAAAVLASIHFDADTELANLDAYAVFLAIAAAGNATATAHTLVDIARRAKKLLMSINTWCDSELRSFVTGGPFGPGPLAALLTRVTYSAEALRNAVSRVRSIDAQQVALLTTKEAV